jgi:tetratricopeptide (TPR) repeat protein
MAAQGSRPVRKRAGQSRPARKHMPRKPGLPEEVPRLRRDVYRDLRAASHPGELDDVVRSFAAAEEALTEGNAARAVEVLTWAKSVAPRSAAVREALGIAHYLGGDFGPAHSELLAYRRLSGNHDQNHLLADCARALGKPDKVGEYVQEMQAANAPPDRLAEGIIVLAGDRADRGDVEGALAVLDRVGLNPEQVEGHHLRVWYFAADLAQRLGRTDEAREYLEAITAVDEEFLDAADQLAALEPR